MNERLLQELLVAGAMEMHDETVKKPSHLPHPRRQWCPLPVVRDCVRAATQQPFLDVMKSTRSTTCLVSSIPLLASNIFGRFPAAAALRVALECAAQPADKPKACPVCLSPSYSLSEQAFKGISKMNVGHRGNFEVFSELCAAVADLLSLLVPVMPALRDHTEQAKKTSDSHVEALLAGVSERHEAVRSVSGQLQCEGAA